MADLSRSLTDRLRADLKSAMQARDRTQAAVLRALIGAIDNAQAVPVSPDQKPSESVPFGQAAETARRPLSADDLHRLLDCEMAEREGAAADIERIGQKERADLLRAEVAIIARYRSI